MSRMYFNSRHLSPVTLHELMNGTVDNVASIPDVSKEGSITGVYVKVPDENINGIIPEDLAAIFEIANKLKINFAIIKNEGGMSFANLLNYGEKYDDTCLRIMNPVSDFIITARELSEKLIEGAKKNKGAASNDRYQFHVGTQELWSSLAKIKTGIKSLNTFRKMGFVQNAIRR